MGTLFAPLIQSGNSDLVYFLLVVPFIVMAATAARHIVGLKIYSMNVFVSMTLIISLLLRKYTVLSAGVGVGILLFIYFFSYFVKKITNALSLHYFSRISFVITMISILLLFLLTLFSHVTNLFSILNLGQLSPYAVVFSVLLSEYFSSNQTQKGFRQSREFFFITLLLAISLGFLVSIFEFEKFLLEYPFIVFIFITVTFLIGRYKGLRFSELRRFREIELND